MGIKAEKPKFEKLEKPVTVVLSSDTSSPQEIRVNGYFTKERVYLKPDSPSDAKSVVEIPMVPVSMVDSPHTPYVPLDTLKDGKTVEYVKNGHKVSYKVLK